MGVFSTKEGERSFAYTIGNCEKGLPELLVIGDHDAWYLNQFSQMMIDRGQAFEHGERVSLGEGGLPCMMLEANESVKSEYTIQATQYYGDAAAYDVMQVVIPDKQGRFPGEDGCAEPFASTPVFPKRVLPSQLN